jgi:DNA-binding NarL/FixJ family response regulator
VQESDKLFKLIAQGFSNRAAAIQLSVSENTIKKALVRVYEKLGVSNRVELVLYALSRRENRENDLAEIRFNAA